MQRFTLWWAMPIALCVALWSADVRAMAGNATSDLPNTRAEEVATPETDDAITSFVIESLPLRETYVSMQRVRYQPGAELAEQPIDGPKLIQILSGSLTVVTAAPGATAYRPPDWRAGTLLEPGVGILAYTATFVLIPAGVPVNFSNRSNTVADWLQVQAETPPTICACGQDLSLAQSEVLASTTLERAIVAPTTLSLARQRLEPDTAISEPDPGGVQLVGIADGDPAALERSQNGAVRNAGNVPVEVFVATIARLDAPGME